MSRPNRLACSLVVASAAIAALLAFAPCSSSQAAPPAAPPPQQAPPAGAPSPTWLVTFDVGPKWDAAKTPQEQPGFAEHLAVVNQLAAEGTLLVGGPLLENFTTHKLTGAVWIVKADDLASVRKLLASDPWTKSELLRIASVRAFFPAGGAWLGGTPHAPPAK
jgi:uncharacterized protein YciI